MSVKDLHWSRLIRIEDVPVIDASLSDQTQRAVVEELPKHDVLIHGRCLELVLLTQIEYLQCPSLSLQCDDELVPVHDSTVCLDRPSYDIVGILQINDYYFWLGIVIDLLPHTDVMVRFECL